MRTVVGLDTGGTFTDSVVVDSETGDVLFQAKTPTTPHDLIVCIEMALRGLPSDLVRSSSMVCLSTTLATNAVVEGRSGREGLVLIGSKPRGKLPTRRQVLVQGRYDVKGRVVENLDGRQVVAAVGSLAGSVEAVAISGYASVRNPDHELYVKAVVEDRLGVPVVCAHELTSQLGFYERTVTAALNASLIPLIWELTDAVKQVLDRLGVDVPLMMVRGDGTLMPEGVARCKPVETILSGPAASAIGALHLSQRSDCLVVDVGGTTTDVVHVRNGQLVIRADGACIGDWRTNVRAVDAFVVGLGGDSRIYVDDTQTLRIGPSRSISYSSAALKCPWLVDELEHVLSEEPDPRVQRPLGDAFTLGRPPLSVDLSRSERSVLDALADGAHTEFELQRLTGLVTLPLVLHALEREGAVKRISMTPTDVWHVTGQFRAGSVRAAELALQMTAQSLGLTVQEAPDVLSRALRRHMDIAVTQGSSQTDLPCLVIGGPASTWWGSSRGSELIEHEVPIHAEVANAVGAAVAHAMESVDVLIRMDTISGRYLVFSPDGRQTSETLDSATHAAVRSGRAFLARVLGMDTVSADVRTADTEISSVGRGENAFVERVVSVTASWQI